MPRVVRRGAARNGPRWLVTAGAFLAAAGLVATSSGCGSPEVAKSDPLPLFERPDRLYLGATPLGRLLVEVDHVEGAPPSRAAIAALRRFLEQHCGKPGGIEIIEDPAIAADRVDGVGSPERIALQEMGRGPEMDDRKTAYLYVLYYENQGKRPYVNWHYPAAIFADVTYFRDAARAVPGLVAADVETSLLVHEAGHVLGLTRRRLDGDGAHCRVAGCVMVSMIEVDATAPPGAARELPLAPCERCTREMAASRTHPYDPRLWFLGPVFVRSERQYMVLRLPGATFLSLLGEDELRAEVGRRSLARLTEDLFAAEPGSGYMLGYLYPPDAPLLRLTPAVRAAASDPDPVARRAAMVVAGALAARGYWDGHLSGARDRGLVDLDPGVRDEARRLPSEPDTLTSRKAALQSPP